jgi:hypothetical protein
VKARAKAINDLFGNRPGRGKRVLQDHPPNRRADHRTLALEVATLYVVNTLGVRAPGGSEEPEEADEEPEVPAEGTEKGKGKEKEEWKGLPHLGDLTWAKQREKWKQEGLDSRQIRRLAAQIQLKALQSLPIFVMKNGETYYSSTMLKYILGVEHHVYILFRLMRDVNRSGESDSDARVDRCIRVRRRRGRGPRMEGLGEGAAQLRSACRFLHLRGTHLVGEWGRG